MAELRKYATLLAAGTAGSTPLVLPIHKAGSADLAASGDWTPAASDTQVSIDEGAFTNTTNLPTYTNGRFRVILTAAELTGKSILVRVVDAATKAVDDEIVEVQTFGHASAFFPGDYTSTSTYGGAITTAQAAHLQVDLTNNPLDAAGTRTAVGLATANLDSQLAVIAGYIDTEVAAIKAKTDNLTASPASVSDIPTTGQIVAAILAGVVTNPTAAPTAPYTVDDILSWLIGIIKFRRLETATTETVMQDDGVTPLATSAKSDDGTTFIRGEYS